MEIRPGPSSPGNNVSCIKVERKEVMNKNMQDSYIGLTNSSKCSVKYVASDNSSHAIPVHCGRKNSQTNDEHTHDGHAKMEIIVDPKMMSYGIEGSCKAVLNSRKTVCTSPDSGSEFCSSLSYSALDKAFGCVMSQNVEDGVKTEPDNVQMHNFTEKFKKSKPDTGSCVLSSSESYILPYNSENDSSCDESEETFKAQPDPMRYNACHHKEILLPCEECQKPIKVEPIETVQEFMDNNVDSSSNSIQNWSDSSVQNVSLDKNNYNTAIYPGHDKTQLNKMKMNGNAMCNRLKDSCSDVQISNCDFSISADLYNTTSDSTILPERNESCVKLGASSKNFGSRQFSCELCGKEFRRKHKLKEHFVCHSDKRPFSCEQCGKSFKMRCDLKRHLKSHSDERPYSCKQCGKAFKFESHLVGHLASHSEQRPFCCERCGKAFKTRSNLETHLVSHSEERPFSCEQCGKSFKTHHKLESHLKSHSEQKPFSCDACGKTFRRHSELKCHLASHSNERPFTCEHCGKAFKTSAYMKEHLRTHSEERPFSCEQCGKAFKTRCDLSGHRKCHSDDRPFSCELCGRKFNVHRGLEMHLFSHSEVKTLFT